MTELGIAWHKTGHTIQACKLWRSANQLGDKEATKYIEKIVNSLLLTTSSKARTIEVL